jgi:hypothetical protein
MWVHVLPEGEPEGDFLDFYASVSTYAMPLAFAASYARHRDLKWAAIHAFFGVPYLLYRGVQLAEFGDTP